MNCIEDPQSMPQNSAQDSKEEEGGEGAAQAGEEGNEASVPPVSEALTEADVVEKARPKPKQNPLSSYQKKVKKNLVPCAYGSQTSCAGSGKILGGGTHGKYRYMCLVCRGQWQQQPPHRLKEGEVPVITFCDGISNKQKREIGATLKEEKKRRKEEEAVSLAESERVSLVPQDAAVPSPKDAQAFHNSKVVERNKENARRVAQQRKILEENEKERIRALEAKRLEDYRRDKEEEMARKEEERRRKAEEKAEARRKQKVLSLPTLPPLAPLPSPLSTDFSDLPPPPSSLSMKMRSKNEREDEREGPPNAEATQPSQAPSSTPPPFIDMLFSSVCITYKLDHGTWVFCPPLLTRPDTSARQVDATVCAC